MIAVAIIVIGDIGEFATKDLISYSSKLRQCSTFFVLVLF